MTKPNDGIRPPTKAEMERDRVFSLINDERYKATVGAWIAQDVEALTRDAMLKDGPDGDKANGGWLALQRILDRISDALKAREDEIKRKAKQLKETT